MTIAFIALGSNLANPIMQIQTALGELAALPDTQLLCHSKYYQNPPVGMLDQADFINAVAKISTKLQPEILLDKLLQIENSHQRVRTEKNGPRTLDLDLLLYDDLIMQTPNLIIPHPRMKERSFVIMPLAEIAPDLVLPCGAAIETFLRHCNINDLEIIEEEYL